MKLLILAFLLFLAVGCRTAIGPVVKPATKPSSVGLTNNTEEGHKRPVLKTNLTKLTEAQKASMRDRYLRHNSEATDVNIVSGPEYECITGWDLDRGCNQDSAAVTCTCPAKKVEEP